MDTSKYVAEAGSVWSPNACGQGLESQVFQTHRLDLLEKSLPGEPVRLRFRLFPIQATHDGPFGPNSAGASSLMIAKDHGESDWRILSSRFVPR